MTKQLPKLIKVGKERARKEGGGKNKEEKAFLTSARLTEGVARSGHVAPDVKISVLVIPEQRAQGI